MMLAAINKIVVLMIYNMYNDEYYVDEGEKKSRSINDIFHSGIRKMYQLRNNLEQKEYTISYLISKDEFDAIFVRLNTAMAVGKLDDSVKDNIFWNKLYNAMCNCEAKGLRKKSYIVGCANNRIHCL